MNTYTQKHTNKYARTVFAQGRPRMVAKTSWRIRRNGVCSSRPHNKRVLQLGFGVIINVARLDGEGCLYTRSSIREPIAHNARCRPTRSSWIDVEFERRAEGVRVRVVQQPCRRDDGVHDGG